MSWTSASRSRISTALAVACGLTAALALPATHVEAANPPAASAADRAPRPEALSAQRRREIEDLRRQDLAASLALRGVSLKWQNHALAEMVDWRDRIDTAASLRTHYGVDVDWRVTALDALVDMRVRAQKASELASLYGIHVDWRLYAWADLERLRLSATRARRDARIADGDALVAPFGVPEPSRRRAHNPRDPDAIIEPTFAFDSPTVWSRPFGRHGKSDPDAILIPTFVTMPTPPPEGGDSLIVSVAGDGARRPPRVIATRRPPATPL